MVSDKRQVRGKTRRHVSGSGICAHVRSIIGRDTAEFTFPTCATTPSGYIDRLGRAGVSAKGTQGNRTG